MVSILYFFHDRLPFLRDRTTDLEFQCREVPVDQQPLVTLPACQPCFPCHSCTETQASSQFELVCQPVGRLRVTKGFRLKP